MHEPASRSPRPSHCPRFGRHARRLPDVAAARSGCRARAGAARPTPAPATAPIARPAAAVAATAPATAPANAQTEFIAPEPIKFEDSVTRAGRKLFRDAQATLGPEPRLMVIDPLIDANTGGQTISTAKMGDDLEALAKKDFRSYAVSPLTRNTLATKPLLLIGTLTPVNIERSIDKQPDAFRVWLTLIDLRSGKVVAKALDRATVDSVNPEPLALLSRQPDLAQGRHDHGLHQLLPGEHQDRRSGRSGVPGAPARRRRHQRGDPRLRRRQGAGAPTGSTRKRSRSPTRATCGC